MRFFFLFLLLLPTLLSADVISVDAYRQRLTRMDGLLRSGDWIAARTEAGKLSGDRIAFGGEQLEPDLSLLRPLATAPNAESARAAAPRLSQLVAALSQVPADQKASADAGLLQRVRRDEELAEIPRGGSIDRRDLGLTDALAEALEPLRRWFDDAWDRFEDWLMGLLPKERKKGLFDLVDLPKLVVGLVVILAVAAAWLTWRTLRRRRRGQEEPVPSGAAPPPPAADADPLSRETGAWERYARELAAAGREREAIRAWYHAVLVALFRRGLLHYRKGRTNWEYISALAPGHTWRARFIEMTRLFEREWYGRDRSSPEALEESEEMALGLLDVVREAA